jgi:hypothetical protein
VLREEGPGRFPGGNNIQMTNRNFPSRDIRKASNVFQVGEFIVTGEGWKGTAGD